MNFEEWFISEYGQRYSIEGLKAEIKKGYKSSVYTAMEKAWLASEANTKANILKALEKLIERNQKNISLYKSMGAKNGGARLLAQNNINTLKEAIKTISELE